MLLINNVLHAEKNYGSFSNFKFTEQLFHPICPVLNRDLQSNKNSKSTSPQFEVGRQVVKAKDEPML